jgi:2-methylcitrate dehydratase PrpD
MNDYLTTFEQYKDVKVIADLIDEVKKLREYYRTQQYDKMQQHINELTGKYLIETLAWNAGHPSMPTTVQQAYLNAETFLRLKGISILLQKGIKTQEQLSTEEAAFIESTIKPQE